MLLGDAAVVLCLLAAANRRPETLKPEIPNSAAARERESTRLVANDVATAEMLHWISSGMGTDDTYLFDDYSLIQFEGSQSPSPSAAASSWPRSC